MPMDARRTSAVKAAQTSLRQAFNHPGGICRRVVAIVATTRTGFRCWSWVVAQLGYTTV